MNKFKSVFSAVFILSLSLLGNHAVADNSSDPFIDEFNNYDIGIAFTMLSKNSWETPGYQLFHDNPSTPQKRLQAVTISNASKKIKPYQADTRYGLAFSMAESFGFYKYFATKSEFTTACSAGGAKMVSPITDLPAKQYNEITNWAVSCGGNDANQQIAFCGRCFDGGVCAGSGNIPNTPNGLWPALGDQVSFAEFQKAKNAIVVASGSMETCQWASQDNIWNEFDTNGLSPKALVGILIDNTTPPPPGSWSPDDATLCSYLQAVDNSRNSWPVYTLTFTQSSATPSKLAKTKTLSCSKDTAIFGISSAQGTGLDT